MSTTTYAVVSALKTALEGIVPSGTIPYAGAPNYYYQYATVALTAAEWETCLQSGPMPWIGILPGKRVNTHPYSEAHRSVMTVQLVAHYQADTDSKGHDIADKLIADIRTALAVDHTLGGIAIDCKVVSDQDDAGDPDRKSGTNGSPVTVLVDVEVTYDRDLITSYGTVSP